MKLHWSPMSPFVRKVMITLHETGQLADVECVRSVVAIHLAPNTQVIADNPLGKIPTLCSDDGIAIFDSRVICEYLDMRAGHGLFPTEPTARIKHLCWQALGDGLIDILLLWRTELLREAGPWVAITDGWQIKVQRSMARLEMDVAELEEATFGIGHIAVICAIGQLDFRWPDCNWRHHFPNLASFYHNVSDRASVQATAIVDDQKGDASQLTSGKLTFHN